MSIFAEAELTDLVKLVIQQALGNLQLYFPHYCNGGESLSLSLCVA